MRDNGGSMFQGSTVARHVGYTARSRTPPARRYFLVLAHVLVVCLPLLAATQTSSPLNVLLNKSGQEKSAPDKGSAKPDSNAAVSSPSTQAQQQGFEPIPLPDIAARSQALVQILQAISSSLPDRGQLNAVDAAISERESAIAAKQQELQTLLRSTPSTLEIREQETYWRGLLSFEAETRKQLLDWANAAQSGVQQLNLQEPLWVATRNTEQTTPGIGPVLTVIDDNLASIRKLRTLAQDDLRSVVNLQIRASAQDQATIDALNQLTKTRLQLKGHYLDRDSLPLWELATRRQEGESSSVYGSTFSRWIAIQAFASENRAPLVFLALLWIVSTLASYRLWELARRRQPADEQQAQVFRILRHWFALGILPPLLFGYLLAPSAPLALIGLAILVSFIPILALLPPLVELRFRKMLYYLAGLYVLNALVAWISFSPVHRREIQFFALAAVTVVLAWLIRPSRVERLKSEGSHPPVVVIGIRLAVALTALSLVANFFGYVKLAQFLAVGCIYSAFIAVSVFTGFKVFKLLLVAGLRSPAAERLAIVRQHREGICRWLPRLLGGAGVLLWFWATLDLFAVREVVVHWLSSVQDFRLTPTSGGITLGQVLGFFLILSLGYTVSRAIRFILREEVLSHFHMPRGVPELISTAVHYLILVLVVLASVKAAGVALDKFTVLTGAVGVGVGFGLQNIINNFISGLILQFERPIHIGDILELDPGVAGTVTRIGIRSSTILTAQGAEIIVPNSNFISNRVTNWTLTEADRRVELPVGVAYGSDLKLVLQLLYEAAATHESVLTQPPPVAYFKQFGESSLDFELQFWVKIESNWVRVRSEVSMVVVQALQKAGIEIPFPQRDLRLRAVEPAAGEALGRDGALSAPSAVENDNSFEPSENVAQIRGKGQTVVE